jgi:serine O-acetyltransferase
MQELAEIILERNRTLRLLPKKELIHQFVDNLFSLLFINANSCNENIENTKLVFDKLNQDFSGLLAGFNCSEESDGIESQAFFSHIPRIYNALVKDAISILHKDPAANSIEEVFYAYPGFYAIAIYRLAHQLWQQQLFLPARIFTEYAHSKTGIDIHPAAHIGESFAIDHGTGVVIGETAVIGNNVQIYQGVTLGALSVRKEEAKTKRHPTIQDNVVIYANSTILGGDTIVGRDSILGGNVWLTHSIPSNSVVYHKDEIKIKDNNPFPDPVNFEI